jgi:hypothetical protein
MEKWRKNRLTDNQRMGVTERRLLLQAAETRSVGRPGSSTDDETRISRGRVRAAGGG